MKHECFRVIRFIPEEGVMQIEVDGIDDPNADIVICEWDDNHGNTKVYHGDNVYEEVGRGTFFVGVVCAISNHIHRNRLY